MSTNNNEEPFRLNYNNAFSLLVNTQNLTWKVKLSASKDFLQARFAVNLVNADKQFISVHDDWFWKYSRSVLYMCFDKNSLNFIEDRSMHYHYCSTTNLLIMCKYRIGEKGNRCFHFKFKTSIVLKIVDPYAAFILACHSPHCRFDGDFCSTAQALLAPEGRPSGKQRQTNQSITSPLCSKRQIADR